MTVLVQFVLFALAFGIDRMSKAFVEGFIAMNSAGPFTFILHQNPGFILQTFENVSPLSRIVFVSSLYGFLFFGYFLVQWLVPESLKLLRASITVFFAAVTGNGYDRATVGAVSDFIQISFPGRIFYFNFADVFMWIGVAGILVALFKSSDVLWPHQSKRKSLLINFRYQSRAAAVIALIAFSTTLILNLFSYTFLKSVEVSGAPSHAFAHFLSATALGLLFSTITFFVGVLLSHRSAGPLYAFEKYVDSLLRGENAKFSLRQKDEHQHLIQLADRLKTHFERELENEKSKIA